MASDLSAETFTLLIADSRPAVIAALRAVLPRQWRCHAAVNRRMARHVLSDVIRPDLMLIGVQLPDGDGFGLLAEIAADPATAGMPVIMVADSTDDAESDGSRTAAIDGRPAAQLTEWRRQAFAMSAADFVNWPCDPNELRTRIYAPLYRLMLQRRLATAEQRLDGLTRMQVASATAAHEDALAMLTRHLPGPPGPHDPARLERLTACCRLLAKRLGGISAFRNTVTPDFQTALGQAVPLHDIGWCAGSDPYSQQEQAPHTTVGARILEDVRDLHPDSRFLSLACELAQFHHENWDGSGQPQGRAKSDIPLSARILRLADAYDTLLAGSENRPPIPHQQAVARLSADGGRCFDPRILDCFLFYEQDFAAFAAEYHLVRPPVQLGGPHGDQQKQAPGPEWDQAPVGPSDTENPRSPASACVDAASLRQGAAS